MSSRIGCGFLPSATSLPEKSCFGTTTYTTTMTLRPATAALPSVGVRCTRGNGWRSCGGRRARKRKSGQLRGRQKRFRKKYLGGEKASLPARNEPSAFHRRTVPSSYFCRFLPVLPPAFNNQVQHRDKEKIQHSRHDHAAEDSCTHRMTSIFAGSRGQHQGYNTQNKRERCHDDRAKTNRCRLHRRLYKRNPASAQLLGELHDQNCVFAGEPDQHDESDLAEHVVLQTANPLRPQGSEQSHRNGQQHDERQHEAFILRRKCEVHDEG